MINDYFNILFNRLSAILRGSQRWPWILVGFVVVTSEIITFLMNSITSLILWGRLDRNLLLIGTIDAFVASAFIGPIAVFLILRAFSLEDFNRKLQKQMAERIRTEQERRILEEKLQQAKKMEALGLLAGGVAHDLNNILVGLVTYPDLLLMGLPPDSPLHKPLVTIKESGERAAAVVQDLLTLARRGVQTETVLNLNNTVRDYLKSLEFATLTMTYPQVAFETGLAPDLLNIRGSAAHLGKALTNLMTNSIEAVGGRPGRVTIVTENVTVGTLLYAYETIPPGDYALVSVNDTGAGIAPDDLARIFEPFYTKKVMGRSGTGLGLAVVWGTVKDHNGFMDVHSKIGEGTRFTIYLPAVHEDIKSACLPEATDAWHGRGETILVVDDEKQQRELAQEILSCLGYVAQTVASGQEAMEYLKKNTVDLVLLDMIMAPGMDGLETYQGILQIRPGQKAIIASGFSESEHVAEAIALGASAYLRKPYSVAVLGQTVRKTLDGH
ncbi:MAG: response regulator [Proteobacteria bacterium]|nr:response regulator [Pseudomonadota bacterium]